MRAMIADVKLYIYIDTSYKVWMRAMIADVKLYIYILTRHKGMNACHDWRRKTIYIYIDTS